MKSWKQRSIRWWVVPNGGFGKPEVQQTSSFAKARTAPVAWPPDLATVAYCGGNLSTPTETRRLRLHKLRHCSLFTLLQSSFLLIKRKHHCYSLDGTLLFSVFNIFTCYGRPSKLRDVTLPGLERRTYPSRSGAKLSLPLCSTMITPPTASLPASKICLRVGLTRFLS